MRQRWQKAVHDPILTDLILKWKRTDRQAGEEMGFDPMTIKIKRQRLKLPVNEGPKPPAYYAPEPPPPKAKPNPMAMAATHLGNRLVEKASGYWLDGRPVNLISIMRETNRLRAGRGMEQLGPVAWHV